MSSSVVNNPSVPGYPQADGTEALQNPTATGVHAPKNGLELNAEYNAKRQQEQQEELQRISTQSSKDMREGFGADDEDSKKALHGIKVGAHAAGVVLSDKALADVHAATKNDPGTQQLIGKLATPTDADTQKMVTSLQEGGKADLGFMQKAYAQSPAAQADAGGGANAAEGSATSPLAGGGKLTTGNWSAFVAMAMFHATREMQIEKKNELNQIKKFNSMLDALNGYVSDTLMPAQQELQEMTTKTKDKGKASSLEVTVYNPLMSLDTDNCGKDPTTGKAILIDTDPSAKVATKVSQVQLSSMIDQANQWRTSISNNQQLHSSNYQSMDTQVTSFLNMITALYKNVNETQQGIVRNLPT